MKTDKCEAPAGSTPTLTPGPCIYCDNPETRYSLTMQCVVCDRCRHYGPGPLHAAEAIAAWNHSWDRLREQMSQFRSDLAKAIEDGADCLSANSDVQRGYEQGIADALEIARGPDDLPQTISLERLREVRDSFVAEAEKTICSCCRGRWLEAATKLDAILPEARCLRVAITDDRLECGPCGQQNGQPLTEERR